ncbi:hypothetical protein HPG69_013034 [Diceros bicornis minor]|uniref:VWFA domain-containing protein n=1 Tax=Diceros bicornis minor TaxID=77932 RepID=A0A7J7F1F3_DICBM|nr:hypothetical protein HPG69_013034 [Diceros bicornis minor]
MSEGDGVGTSQIRRFQVGDFSGHNMKMLLILFLIIMCPHVSVNQDSAIILVTSCPGPPILAFTAFSRTLTLQQVFRRDKLDFALQTSSFDVSLGLMLCPQFADVVFLVDSSDHLGTKSFPFVKMFITKVISSLPIEADKYRIIKDATQYKDGAVNDILVEVCQGPSVADVVFLLDVSINGSQENFDYLKEFLEESVSALDIKEHCMRVALVAFSNETKVINSLSRGINKSEVLQYIQNLSPQAGKAYTGAAIRKIRKEVFSAKNGSRKNQGVPQIAVLVTHRPSEDNVTKAAVTLRRQGVTIFTLGIEGSSDTQLEKIASHPAEQYVSKLKTFSDLAAHNQTFLKKLRNQITHKVSVFSERTETLKSGCVDTEEADIYLLIDGSGSTQATDFHEMKTFLSEVVGMFNIAPQKVRVGAVQYADSWDLEFEINKYSNKHDLGKAIENIRQMGGNTNTGAALNFTLGLLQKAKKQRGNKVPCHLVVLTNGVSKDSILEPANRLREELIHVYAIGVKEANQTQLREIAGEEKRVYYVHDFDALKDIRNQVVQEICAEEACKEMKADIMFLVDSSGSIGPENFSKMKTFMKNLVSKSQIGADRVQIGVVQFSDVNKEEFPLNRYVSESEISSAIDRMAHIGETTLTGGALTFVSQYFSAAKGARPNVRKFLILITDGEAQDIVKDPAIALRQEGIIIYSVGVFGSNVTQLEEISGRPEMVFYVENFDILQHIEDDLVFGICSPREECKRIEVLDVVFVIDSSGSIDYDEYNIMKDFMTDLVKKANVGQNQVRFGALKYADDPEVLFYLDNLGTKWEVISMLQNDQPMGGNTYTAEALAFSDHMFTEARGSRLHKGVPQVLIVITDGESHDADKLNATAKALQDKGILVLAVGIAGANPVELLAMAGSSDKYFFVETFGGLKGIFSDVSASVCNSSKVDCEIGQIDLVFLMDGSNSIGPEDFKKMKEFLASVVQDFDVSVNRVRIGAAQFSHSYQPEFPLGTFIGKREISLQIEKIQQIFGYTHIGAALRQVGHYFQPDMGSRINAGTPQVLLVLTDGQSQDEVAEAAEDLRRKGINIYSVGIGDVDDQQLIQITGTADKKLTVHNFDELRKVKKRIVRNICTSGGESNCFVDVVVGFDISTQKNGQTLLEGQSWMETYLQHILRAISSLNGVSCEVGTETQVSVAFQVTNAMEKYSPKFEIYSENILNSLKDVTVKGPSLLNANLLSSLWDAFQNKSATRGKVVLLFSDGLDDDVEKLEQKSDVLRKEGLNALITVALDGATNSGDLADLLYIEFGKGFEYSTQLTIGMRDLGSQLSKHLVSYSEKADEFKFSICFVNVAERTCCCLFCKCIGGDGEMGDPGPPGKKGSPGFKGSEGYLGEEGTAGERGAPGPVGEQGTKGCYGAKGPKGNRGLNGQEGDIGESGIDGLNGEKGDNGLPGGKGEKGDEGSQFKNNFSRKIFNYSNQEDKLFAVVNVIKNSCLVLLLICINFREARDTEGFLVTVEQRACEETLCIEIERLNQTVFRPTELLHVQIGMLYSVECANRKLQFGLLRIICIPQHVPVFNEFLLECLYECWEKLKIPGFSVSLKIRGERMEMEGSQASGRRKREWVADTAFSTAWCTYVLVVEPTANICLLPRMGRGFPGFDNSMEGPKGLKGERGRQVITWAFESKLVMMWQLKYVSLNLLDEEVPLVDSTLGRVTDPATSYAFSKCYLPLLLIGKCMSHNRFIIIPSFSVLGRLVNIGRRGWPGPPGTPGSRRKTQRRGVCSKIEKYFLYEKFIEPAVILDQENNFVPWNTLLFFIGSTIDFEKIKKYTDRNTIYRRDRNNEKVKNIAFLISTTWQSGPWGLPRQNKQCLSQRKETMTQGAFVSFMNLLNAEICRERSHQEIIHDEKVSMKYWSGIYPDPNLTFESIRKNPLDCAAHGRRGLTGPQATISRTQILKENENLGKDISEKHLVASNHGTTGIPGPDGLEGSLGLKGPQLRKVHFSHLQEMQNQRHHEGFSVKCMEATVNWQYNIPEVEISKFYLTGPRGEAGVKGDQGDLGSKGAQMELFIACEPAKCIRFDFSAGWGGHITFCPHLAESAVILSNRRQKMVSSPLCLSSSAIPLSESAISKMCRSFYVQDMTNEISKLLFSKENHRRQAQSDIQESVILYWLYKSTDIGFIFFYSAQGPAIRVE